MELACWDSPPPIGTWGKMALMLQLRQALQASGLWQEPKLVWLEQPRQVQPSPQLHPAERAFMLLGSLVGERDDIRPCSYMESPLYGKDKGCGCPTRC